MKTPWSKLVATLPEKPMSSDCACDSQRYDKTRAIVYDEGWHVTCLKCAAQWVEHQLSGSRQGRS